MESASSKTGDHPHEDVDIEKTDNHDEEVVTPDCKLCLMYYCIEDAVVEICRFLFCCKVYPPE
ncbi:Hypothetical protein CINCED_3A001497 [Cinara cedri]|uniref:Uncharacterized protein n=1 Tax=Cinara cedri TaxID=506608 RepID=A0A5E4N8M4_9HEMI|nr:Hypothetical protein CINCED_3A001497 [Cinara cedri]